jgi:hypothetical protein
MILSSASVSMQNADVNIGTSNLPRINGINSRSETIASTSTTTPSTPIQNSPFGHYLYANSIRTNGHPSVHANTMDCSRTVPDMDDNEELNKTDDGSDIKFSLQLNSTGQYTDTKNNGVSKEFNNVTSQRPYVLRDLSMMTKNQIVNHNENDLDSNISKRKNQNTTNDSSATLSKSLGSHSIIQRLSAERFQGSHQQRHQQQTYQTPIYEHHNILQTINCTLPSIRYECFSQKLTPIYFCLRLIFLS